MSPVRLASLSITLALGLGQLACTPPDVVAKVGARRVRRADVELHRRTTGATAEQSLEALISRERLTQAALDHDIAKNPAIAARLASAEREILAQAYLDSALADVNDGTALKYFEEQKDSLTYRQLHLGHIFVALPASSDPAATRRAESKANTLWSRLLGGEDFAALAEHDSEDTATASRGGDLGLIKEGSVDATLFEAGATLEHGAVSKPIRTPFGLHILKALGPRERITPPFAEVRPKLLARLRQEREGALLKQLEGEISVTRRPEALKEGDPK